MAESLLAHLYTRIKGSQEDVATMSLHYIISAHKELGIAYNKLLSDKLKINLEPEIHYNIQSVGKNSERPDMSGADNNGKEQILCEMKFYAGLTENQPNGYLDRLIKEDGKALAFVCPEDRRISLWNKVKELCVQNGRSLSDEDGYRVTVDGIAMAIVTWTEIIEELRRVASSVAIEALPDIVQLAGLCNMMENEAFIPFTDEELGPQTARKQDRYYQVVDAVVNKLMTMKDFDPSIKGVRATPFAAGYSRAIRLKGIWAIVSYDRRGWKNTMTDVPFWVTFRDSTWKQPEEFKPLFDMVNGKERTTLDNYEALALHPLTYAPLDDIADDMVKQILEYHKILIND